jgi:GTPase SAR1 family protein
MESFNNIKKKWLPEIRKYETKVPIILIANKIDLRNNQRIVNFLAQMNVNFTSKQQLLELSKEIGACATIECSSKTMEGIEILMKTVARVVSFKQHQNCCLII